MDTHVDVEGALASDPGSIPGISIPLPPLPNRTGGRYAPSMSTSNSVGQRAAVLRRKSGVRVPPGAPSIPGPDWSRVVKSTGYLAVFHPGHPRAWSTGYVYVHVVVAEHFLGRRLDLHEQVHHIDRDKWNNSADNLQVLTKAAHTKEHHPSTGEAWVSLLCPWCGRAFDRVRRNTHLVKGGRIGATCCSATCRGRLSAARKYSSVPPEVQARLTSPQEPRAFQVFR